MRTQQLLGIAVLPLLLASCAEDVGRDEGAQERMDKARAVLEQQGYEFRGATHGYEGGPRGHGTSLPPERESAAVFVWCEGAGQGPSFSLDGVERGTIPCSEDGQISEVVAGYRYTGQELELRTEEISERVQWAFAVGVAPGVGEGASTGG